MPGGKLPQPGFRAGRLYATPWLPEVPETRGSRFARALCPALQLAKEGRTTLAITGGSSWSPGDSASKY